MPDAQSIRSSNPLTPGVLLRMAIGALGGAVVGFGFITLLTHAHITPRQLGWSDGVALWVCVVLLAFALIVAIVSTNRTRLAKELERDATLPASNEEVSTTRLQAAVLGLASVMLATPIFAQNLIATRPDARYWIFALILGLFALQTWLNLRLWNSSDEFARAIIRNLCALTFAIGQGILFLTAAAEHLHLIHALSAWNVSTFLIALYLVVSFYISLRQARS